MWTLISGAFSSVGGLLTMLAVIAGLTGFGAFEMHKIDEGKYQTFVAAQAKAQAAAEEKAAATQKQVDDTALAAAGMETAAQTALTTNLHEELANVPIVKTVAINCVPYGFVRVLDAAASGRALAGLALPAGKSDDACAPFDWNAVARSIVSNYFTARANAEQLNQLVTLLQDEQKAMAK
jgi:hypothetical protein